MRIAIVGAGFTGSMLAARLLRSSCAELLHVLLIERGGVFGPGLAYGKAKPTNLLNVPAGNMSALDDDAGHFLRWAQEIDPAVRTGDFLPRRMYGQYIRQTFEAAAVESRGRLTRIESEAVGAQVRTSADAPDATTGAVELVLAGGERLACDHLVLCTGNFPPSALPGLPESLEADGLLVRDPWSPAAIANLEPEADLLLVGTGLTMIDLVSDLRQAGHRGTVHAISRRGLLPASHRGPSKPPPPRKAPELLSSWDGRALTLLRIMRGAIDQATREGIDWREVITSVRGLTPWIWQKMDTGQRRAFLRHVRAYWETARHRLAPQVAKGVREAMVQGLLVIHAGRVASAARQNGKVAVRIAPRGCAADEARTILVSRIINCTGPDSDIERSDEPLLRSLLAQGLIRPDPLHLGADCAPSGAVIDRQGITSEILSVAGPLRKGLLWETTAVPELRKQVSELAARLTAPLVAESLVPRTRDGGVTLPRAVS